ncbi:MAG: hypothetical protein ACLTNK_03295 [Akkermansia muciniphila]
MLEDALKSTPTMPWQAHVEIARDPVRTNPALSPEHVKNVKSAVASPGSSYELGQYDGLDTSVLKTDP